MTSCASPAGSGFCSGFVWLKTMAANRKRHDSRKVAVVNTKDLTLDIISPQLRSRWAGLIRPCGIRIVYTMKLRSTWVFAACVCVTAAGFGCIAQSKNKQQIFEIPFDFYRNEIIVQVKINGQGPFKMML